MKFTHCLFILFFVRDITGATLRKLPAFATPEYSNSYLPATLQVIFHSVEQLRYLHLEELQENTTSLIPSTSSHPPGHHQLYSTSATTKVVDISPTTEKVDESKDKIYDETSEPSQVTSGINEETPEQNQETPEVNYATPESNYETPESVQSANENEEKMPGNSTTNDTDDLIKKSTIALNDPATTPSTVNVGQNNKKKPTIDSVVDEVYDLVKPSSKKSDTSINFEMDSVEKSENLDEEEEETRFTLLGEKVNQVPRPSMSSYLRRAKVPPRGTLHQLALLYDALSKDARKQGYAKYAGYSDTVLKVLETSAGGGAGMQLKTLLEKTLEHDELTRDDAKIKAKEALRDLEEPATQLSTDLRRLLPLHYKL